MTRAEEERARVVAYIRRSAMQMAIKVVGPEHAHDTLSRVQARLRMAELIEQGEHLKEQPA